jgi:transposase
MSRQRRKFDEDFKRRAVQLSYTSEQTIQETADSLGIHVSLLNRWRRQYTPAGEKTQLTAEQEENQRLRLRIAELERENDLLKKASAYFAKHQR